MLQKPHSFDDIIGHEVLKKYIIDRIKDRTLPQFIIFDGSEGLGKTALALVTAITLNYGFGDSPEKSKAISEVIDNKRSIDCIRRYNMAKDSGKDTAREVLAEMNPAMSSTGTKVNFCDECHRMSDNAQDAILEDTEYIPKNTYLFMSTTDTSQLKPALLSRAIVLPLHNLKTSEMLVILKKEVASRNLTIQGGEGMLRMIAEWSDNKPRAALNIINAFGENVAVSQDVVKEFIGYLDIDEVLPLVVSLSGSMTYGLSYINEIRLSDSIIDVTVELLRIKLGQASYKLDLTAYKRVKGQLEMVPEECIMKFLHQVAAAPRLTRSALVAAYTSSHVNYNRLFTPDKDVKLEELRQKGAIETQLPNTLISANLSAPQIDDLVADSALIEE